MAELETEQQQSRGKPGSIFECEFCASRYLARVVPYNELGYPICPVCQYEHGPKPGE